MNAGSIEATRELCVDLDNLIELTKESRAPIRALSLIERARADLQAYLDEIEGTFGAGRAWSRSGWRLCVHYDQIGGAGGGNYHEIVGFHNPKGVFAGYRDFDEDPHNRNQNQHDGCDKDRLETFGQAVDGEPNKISADQDPKGVALSTGISVKTPTTAAEAIASETMRPKNILDPKVAVGQPEE
jgi:hypothetical protein